MRAAAVLTALFLTGCVETPEPRPDLTEVPACAIDQIVDGDTFVVACKGKRVLGRLSGVDSPEIGSAVCPAERAKGQAARTYLQELVAKAPVTDVRYGARIADSQRQLVDIELGGEDLAGLMVAAGHARRISGTDRPDWCSAG
jgi:endonuclease YncB( thermonuclease family)